MQGTLVECVKRPIRKKEKRTLVREKRERERGEMLMLKAMVNSTSHEGDSDCTHSHRQVVTAHFK